jgi:hypothetical protein
MLWSRVLSLMKLKKKTSDKEILLYSWFMGHFHPAWNFGICIELNLVLHLLWLPKSLSPFFFFVCALVFELRASCLLGRHSITWATLPAPSNVFWYGNTYTLVSFSMLKQCWIPRLTLFISNYLIDIFLGSVSNIILCTPSCVLWTMFISSLSCNSMSVWSIC